MNRVLLTFTISVLFAILCPKDGALCYVVPCTLVVLQISLYFLRKRFVLLPLILGFMFGLFLVNVHQSKSQLVSMEGETVSCVMEVQSVPWKTDSGIGFDGEVVSANGNAVSEKVICYMNEEAAPKLNTCITLKNVKIKLPNEQLNFNSFNYRRFLESRNVYVIISANNAEVTHVEKCGWSIKRAAAKANENLCNFIDSKFKPKNAALLKGILLGDKSDMSDETQESFRKSGLSHALAVSGMHLAVITSILGLFLKRCRRKVRGFVLLIVIWAFSFIVGLPISVVRASFMLSFLIVADCLLWEKDGLTNLALAALLLIMHNPNVVYDISFSMSFSATLGILCIVPFFSKIKSKYLPHKIKESLCVSFAALIGSMPVALFYFGHIYFVGLISNLFVMILIPIIYFLTFIAFVFPFDIFFSLGDFFLNLLTEWSEFCSKIPYLSFTAPDHPLLWCGVVGLVLTFLFVEIIRKMRFMAVLVMFFAALSLIGYNLGIAPPKHTEITFINVQQADCALIRTSSGENFLIDVGTEHAATKEVVPFLEREGVLEITGIFISHFDADHCGGLAEIMDNFEVHTIYVANTSDVGQAQYASLCRADAYNVRVVPLLKNDVVKTDTITFTVLYPEFCASDNHNDSSLVIRADSKDCSAVFTGDLEKDNVLQNCDADVLKVSHHGSANGSTEAFIQKCSPDIAVISLGLNNGYGFPKPEVMSRLYKQTKHVYRTDLNGTVRILCDNKKYYVQTLR